MSFVSLDARCTSCSVVNLSGSFGVYTDAEYAVTSRSSHLHGYLSFKKTEAEEVIVTCKTY